MWSFDMNRPVLGIDSGKMRKCCACGLSARKIQG